MYFSLFQICKIHLISSKHKYKQDQGSWWFSLEENFWFQKVHLELPHKPASLPSIKQLFWMQDWARNHGERGDNDNFSHRDLWSSLEMGGGSCCIFSGLGFSGSGRLWVWSTLWFQVITLLPEDLNPRVIQGEGVDLGKESMEAFICSFIHSFNLHLVCPWWTGEI